MEINYTFRRCPTEKSSRVARLAPKAFRFTLKANQRITHCRRLSDADDDVREFLETASARRAAGPVLYQCPPSLHYDRSLIEAFVGYLPPVAERARWSSATRPGSRLGTCCSSRASRGASPRPTRIDPGPDDLSWEPFGYLRLRKTEYSGRGTRGLGRNGSDRSFPPAATSSATSSTRTRVRAHGWPIASGRCSRPATAPSDGNRMSEPSRSPFPPPPRADQVSRPARSASSSSAMRRSSSLRPSVVADVEGVDDPGAERRDLRQVHVELELGEGSRDVEEQPDAVGRAHLDHGEEVGRVVVDVTRTGTSWGGDRVVARASPAPGGPARGAPRSPRGAFRGTRATVPPPPRPRTYPRPRTGPSATPSSVVNTWAVRIDSPASVSAPAIHRQESRAVGGDRPRAHTCPAASPRTSIVRTSSAPSGRATSANCRGDLTGGR